MSLALGLGLALANRRASAASLELDFLKQRYSVSQLSKNFSDIITFTRPSASTRINPLGLVESVAANVPCIDHSPVNLATGVGAQTLALAKDRSYAITAVGGTVAVAGAGVNVSQMGAAAGVIHTPAGTGTVDVTFTQGGGITALHVREVLGLGVWEQRTNYWVTASDPVSVTGGTSSVSAIPSPIPSVNYSEFIEDTANTIKQLEFYRAGLTSGQTYAFSLDVKPDTITSIDVWNFVSGILGSVNLLTGVSTNPNVKTEKNSAGGWRITWTVVAASSAVNFRIYFNSGNAFLGTGRRFYFANMQVEEGAFSTPRIPTTTAQVTRAADVPVINTISPWLGLSGYLLLKISIASPVVANKWQAIAGLDDGSYQNSLRMWCDPTGAVFFQRQVSGAIVETSRSVSFANSSPIKIALGFDASRLLGSVGGNLVGPVAHSGVPGVNRFTFGGASGLGQFNGWISRVEHVKKLPSNAQFAALTA